MESTVAEKSNSPAVATLRFSGVGKAFGSKVVLKNLNFEVRPREFTVLLGPNGAGKSTAIALASGLLHPDAGAIEIFGQPAGTISAKRWLGFVPQEPAFPAHVRGIDLLKFSASHSMRPRDIKNLLSELDLAKFIYLPVRHMSGGQRRLVSVACAFVLDFPFVILDEPTTGLDVEMRRQVWRLLSRYREAGGSILMTTHYLAEAEALATNVIVLASGAVAQQGSPADIKKKYGYKRIEFSASEAPPVDWTARAFDESGRWTLDSSDPDEALAKIVAWGHATDINVAPMALEDVFLHLIGRPN